MNQVQDCIPDIKCPSSSPIMCPDRSCVKNITRCDDVANGIVEALKKMDISVPIVIRLTGTNEEEGRKILEKTDLIPASSMTEGAKKAIELVGKGS